MSIHFIKASVSEALLSQFFMYVLVYVWEKDITSHTHLELSHCSLQVQSSTALMGKKRENKRILYH